MSAVLNKINLFSIKQSKYIGPVLLLLLAGFICTLAYFNEVCEGEADNYWHYYFSKYAFKYPKYFLHHWGKPVFIFLSAPFAQLGYYALNIFNIICGVLSAFVAYKWSKKLNLGYNHMAIILVLFAPMYFAAIQSALTEPLFSLLLIFSAYLLFFEKYLFGTIVASFLMYSRTEGMFIILIFLVYLILVRKLKFIPFLATAFIIYSFIGYFSGHDFFWYFTENPYNAKSPYGSGSWMHFINGYRLTFGGPYVFCFIGGLILLLQKLVLNKEYLFWKNQGRDFKIFCLVFVPTVAFFLFHVYAWGAGKYASAGVERVMASVIPLGAMLCMYFVDLIYKLRFPFVRTLIMVVLTVNVVKATFKHFKYPAKAYGAEKVEAEAAKWFKQYRKPNSIIYYAHPAIIFYCDYDPFGPDNRECFGFPNDCKPIESTDKFYYFWDSWFSESSCKNKLEDMEKFPRMKKIKEFKGEQNFKLVVFESQ